MVLCSDGVTQWLGFVVGLCSGDSEWICVVIKMPENVISCSSVVIRMVGYWGFLLVSVRFAGVVM